MADDWQVGDLAMLVRGRKGPSGPRAGYAENGEKFLRRGGIYTVEAVVRPGRALGLVLEGHHSAHPSRSYLASAFRRIRPLTDEERRSFVAELDAPILQPNQEVAQALLADGRP